MSYYYLSTLSHARFANHPCSMELSKLLRLVRGADHVYTADIICVQALLELLEIQNYGPFQIVSERALEKTETIKLLKDETLLLQIEKSGLDIILIYISDDMNDLEEFCALAAAHAKLKNETNDKR